MITFLFITVGNLLGTIVALPLSGLLAAKGFAGGWPSIFYVFGEHGFVFGSILHCYT